MNILEILFISICLAADSFAVSLCKGLSLKRYSIKISFLCGMWFGVFQFIMPIIGYKLGNTFVNIITRVDHYVVFLILLYIGFNMIKTKEEKIVDDKVDMKTMFMFAIATSIDALAIGISLSILKVNIVISSLIIGIVAFIISFIGVILGRVFGNRLEDKANIIGGVVLILIGIKILIEHLL